MECNSPASNLKRLNLFKLTCPFLFAPAFIAIIFKFAGCKVTVLIYLKTSILVIFCDRNKGFMLYFVIRKTGKICSLIYKNMKMNVLM